MNRVCLFLAGSVLFFSCHGSDSHLTAKISFSGATMRLHAASPGEGWTATTDADGDGVVFANGALAAEINLKVMPAKQVSPASAAGYLLTVLAAQGANISQILDVSDGQRAGFVFEERSASGSTRRGQVLARRSNSADHNLLFIGLWPPAHDAEMTRAFELLVKTARLEIDKKSPNL